jgi:hypothetical protein
VRDRFRGRQQVAYPDDLFDDLGGAQVPFQALKPAGAEDATHSAADLSTQTNRPARAFEKKDTLDMTFIVASQDQFLRAISGNIVTGDRSTKDCPVSVKLGSQGFGEVCH